MNLDELRAMAHPVDPELARQAPDLRVDSDEDVAGVFAYFGGDRTRLAIRVVIEGEEAGYVERLEVLDLFDVSSMGLGDSDRALLQGRAPASGYRFLELECPMSDCPEPPQFVLKFDADVAPRCRAHPDAELRPRS